MSFDERRLVAAILACLPLFAVAQGYKCKQADGSVSYQDHACAAGVASSSVVPTGAGAAPAGNSLAVLGIDARCQQSMDQASHACSSTMDTSLKACWRARLPPACFAQVTAPPGAPRDAACIQQATQSTCTQEALAASTRCTRDRLPASCMQQLTTFNDAYQRRSAACAPQVQRWREQLRSCGHRGLTSKQEEDCLEAVPHPDCR